MKKYKYEDVEYNSLWEVRQLLPNVSFPAEPTDKQLAKLGITVIAVEPEELPEPTLEEVKERARDTIARLRLRDEEAGMFVGDMQIHTDRVTQAKMTANVMFVKLAPDYAIPDWKCMDGAFVSLDAAMIMHVAKCMATHVQACFSKERQLAGQIDACETGECVLAVMWDEEPRQHGNMSRFDLPDDEE